MRTTGHDTNWSLPNSLLKRTTRSNNHDQVNLYIYTTGAEHLTSTLLRREEHSCRHAFFFYCFVLVFLFFCLYIVICYFTCMPSQPPPSFLPPTTVNQIKSTFSTSTITTPLPTIQFQPIHRFTSSNTTVIYSTRFFQPVPLSLARSSLTSETFGQVGVWQLWQLATFKDHFPSLSPTRSNTQRKQHNPLPRPFIVNKSRADRALPRSLARSPFAPPNHSHTKD